MNRPLFSDESRLPLITYGKRYGLKCAMQLGIFQTKYYLNINFSYVILHEELESAS